MNSWKILKKCLKEEQIVKCSNGLNPLSSKTKIKKIKECNKRKREAIKEEAPLASTRKPQVYPPPQEGKKNWKKPYPLSYRIPRIQKDGMDNVLNMARNLMEFKDKEKERMIQPSSPNK
ncbi:hypothetical protein O181_103721 [Austropuccinia psidii MF-1]|uniref:Uncharacterized protein n=1 Tax=Austropuccinia psidii MF-1 TaxID=1389203 RepID=A0A9Q3PKS1_9BASI|nr:hypothetical protein [Austropuccinia psidii MF-1]